MLVLDAGHGGLLRGRYTTRGKFYDHGPDYNFHKGGIIYEGLINRAIVNAMVDKLERIHFPYLVVSDPVLDITLADRVNLANSVAPRKSLYMSIHANASKDQKGRGYEVFHGRSESSKLAANLLQEQVKKVIKGKTPDRGVKTFQFYVLAYTKMPAILSENLFFDNLQDARLLFEPGMIDALATAHVEAAIRFLSRP